MTALLPLCPLETGREGFPSNHLVPGAAADEGERTRTSKGFLGMLAVVPTWRAGDTIPLGPDRTLRVVAIRDDDAGQPPAVVVQSA
jgi:hypothetical protein